jgi:DNA protecting protein DprA
VNKLVLKFSRDNNCNVSTADTERLLNEVRETFGLALSLRDLAREEESVRNCLENNVNFISIESKTYPKKLLSALGMNSPPILSYWGNLDILDAYIAGFCGSRKASERGTGAAEDCAKQLALGGSAVVAGNAAGVDTAAHRVALKNGGATIFVLPEGILRFRWRSEVESLITERNALVLSEFSPNLTWFSYNAMRRNKTIVGLSDSMFVIEAGMKGGTMDAGLTAIEFGKPVFSPVYEEDIGEGNKYLIQRGAEPLYRSRNTGCASLEKVFSKKRSDVDASKEGNKQFNLL